MVVHYSLQPSTVGIRYFSLSLDVTCLDVLGECAPEDLEEKPCPDSGSPLPMLSLRAGVRGMKLR